MRGFTLVELMIVVAIVGIAVTLGIVLVIAAFNGEQPEMECCPCYEY